MPFKRSLQEAVEAAIQASHPSQPNVSAWDRPWEPLGKTGKIMGRSTINGGCNGKIMGTWREQVGKYGTRTYTMEVSRWANHHTKWKIVRFTRAWDDVSFPEKMVCCFC